MKKKYLLWAIVALQVGILAAAASYIMKLEYNHNEIAKEDLGIKEDFKVTKVQASEVEEEIDISGIKNIALFGLDRRSSDEESTRSDSIMVATVNFDTNEIKLTSFMRDMAVEIEGRGQDKLNHAYAFGGPELTIKTLNQNFDLNIEDYVSVDFLMLEEIIDSIGGITLEIDEEERKLINQYVFEIDKKNNRKSATLEGSGEQVLSGAQAVAYSRIRKHGNGDYERTERQRGVLSAMLTQLSKAKLSELPNLASSVLKNTETSISQFEALKLAKDYLTNNFSSLQTERIPRDGSFSTGNALNGAWVMWVDFEKEKQFLREWIFNSNPDSKEGI